MDKLAWEQGIERIEDELIPMLRKEISPDAIRKQARIEFASIPLSELHVIYSELNRYGENLSAGDKNDDKINFKTVSIHALSQTIEMGITLKIVLKYPDSINTVKLLLKELKFRQSGLPRFTPDILKMMVYISIRLYEAEVMLNNRVIFGKEFQLPEMKGKRAMNFEMRMNAIKGVIMSLPEEAEIPVFQIYKSVEKSLGYGSGDGRALSEYIRRNLEGYTNTYPKSVEEWRTYFKISNPLEDAKTSKQK